MSEKDYTKHTCVLLKETDTNKHELAEMQTTLREIQEEQLLQRKEMQRMASELKQPKATESRQGGNSGKPASELGQSDAKKREQDPAIARQPIRRSKEGIQSKATKGQQTNRSSSKATSPFIDYFGIYRLHLFSNNIVVAGGGSKSYEVFDKYTEKWTVHNDTLFFDHNDGFSFLYDKKIMICGGTDTNRVECLDIANDSTFASTFPVKLPGTDCGKGVLCGDRMLTFGQSASAISLKSPFKTTALLSYNEGSKLSSYGIARVNQDTVALIGGYTIKSGEETCDRVLTFNSTRKVFKTLAPLPYSVAEMAVLVHQGNLVILGGMRSYYKDSPGGGKLLISESLNGVLMYNITNQQCRKLPSMLEKRSRCAAVIIGDKIVVVGGNSELQSERTVKLKTAEYLVLGEDRWRRLPSMHHGRAGATACVLP